MNTIKNYGGFEYVVIRTNEKSIPIKVLLEIEKNLAHRIVRERPFRGKEISFLRKHLKLSCAKLSSILGGNYDPSTISRWEKEPEKRLSPQNEMFMRIFFAESFGIDLEARSELLVPVETGEIVQLTA